MKKEKSVIIILIIVLVIILGVGLFTGEKKESKKSTSLSNDVEVILSNAQKESKNISDKEKKEFIMINAEKYLDYYKADNKTIILLAKPTCHYCQIAEPILANIAYEYDLDINYLNTDEFTQEDKETVINSDAYFSNGLGTPILLIVSNEEIVDVVDGLTDTAHYLDFFKKNGLIK